MSMPASRAFSAPPRRISPSTETSSVRVREADEVERRERRAAHRVDVAQRVGRGDRAEVVRLVDDGREEVRREDERALVVDPVHGGVVRRGAAHEDVRDR